MKDNNNEIRINKFISESGFCSRREADRLIEEGRVRRNKEILTLGSKVLREDKICIDDQVISIKKRKKIYLMFNKPVGIVCTTDTKKEKNNIIDYINFNERIFPIGRLDKLSQGLIFLTNDGDIVNKILRSKNKNEKEYEVVVNKPITNSFIEKMKSGVPILGTTTRKCSLFKTGEKEFRIILTQGLNRQIRRMCEYLGYRVKKLKRTRIMNITLDIKEGKYRKFKEDEINRLNEMLLNSSKTNK